MEIIQNKQGNVLVLDLNGRLDTTNYTEAEKQFMEFIKNNEINIVVDCSGLEYISSSGLRVFLMTLKKITSLKGKFVLCGLRDNINEIFEISGFTSIFDIQKDKDTALNQF